MKIFTQNSGKGLAYCFQPKKPKINLSNKDEITLERLA